MMADHDFQAAGNPHGAGQDEDGALDRHANVFWLDGAEGRRYPPLADDLTLDVAIIGAGMAGLHCAWALKETGLRVGVFEARRIGRQATGRSTAKVTSQHGLCYSRMVSDFGDDHARIHAQENEKALGLIAELCGRIGPDAGFEPCDAFVLAEDDGQVGDIEREAEAARAAGIAATIERGLTIPIVARAALRFPGQGQIDPFGYLQGLAAMTAQDAAIHEDSRVESVEYGEPCRLRVNGREVRAGHVVVATQIPIVGEGDFFAKVFAFAHPVAAAPMPDGVAMPGMYINAGSPSRSFRAAGRDGRRFLIVCGDEYRLGEPDGQRAAVDDLRRLLKETFGVAEPTHLWTNEDFRPMDGAAFIGPADRRHSHLLVATGFAAWGLTQGVVAGEMLAALIRGRDHPAAALYDSTRRRMLAGGGEFLKENMKAGGHMAGDRLLGRKNRALDDLAPGEGGIVSHKGEKLAVRRDDAGRAAALSAICTHMGCVVDWNDIDRTWDCPCHGSRFDETGAVLAGPASAPLMARELDKAADD